MREIQLTKGHFALVDDEDYEILSQYKWHAKFNKNTNSFYANRSMTLSRCKQYSMRMHREIMGSKPYDGTVVDHINHNTLDNRKSNLRIATISQNNMNRRVHKNSTTGVAGVSYCKRDSVYCSHIYIDKKQIWLGSFKKLEEASLVRKEAEEKYYGEYVCNIV